jgi:hypothetical protein
LKDFEVRARAERRPELLSEFPAKRVISGFSSKWRAPAIAIFRNWLDYIASRKLERAAR